METSSPNIAAVDLGSNSFHMVIARHSEHDLTILDRIKEPVYLAGGLDDADRLSDEAQARAIACLERFGQRLRGLDGAHVRAVGTNTFRRARAETEFRSRAEVALGHRIEIIPGTEEARLIYLGVAHAQANDPAPRLVVDIGGGSTEVIVGEGFEVLRAHSLFMGCVTYSQRFFPGGDADREAFSRAETAAGLELQGIASSLTALSWDSAIGASGTVNAVVDILRDLDNSTPGITLVGLKNLRRIIVAAGNVEKAALPGLRPERARVLAGGLAILLALFKSLEVSKMSPSSGALREGLLYDLLGRIHHEDVRDRTIARLVEQYRVDLGQATRVERTAATLLPGFAIVGGIEETPPRRLLTWAARLHEIGLALSHTGYHKHSAYLIANTDLPGYSADEQTLLAALVRNQRRRVDTTVWTELPKLHADLVRRLTVVFRLAVLLNRGRAALKPPTVTVDDDGGRVRIQVPQGWKSDHPLSVADLEEEAVQLAAIGVALSVVEAE